MKILIITLLSLATLSACVVKENPAHRKVYYPGLGTVDHHCPPGQHKKGRC